MSDFLAALCPHLPGAWRVVEDGTISDGTLAIYCFHDQYRRKRIFGPRAEQADGCRFYDGNADDPKISVSDNRLPESVAGDIRRKLLPHLPAYFERYEVWRENTLAHKQRREGNFKMLMDVSGVAPERTSTDTGDAQLRMWGQGWDARIEATTVEIRWRGDAETAAAILELLRG